MGWKYIGDGSFVPGVPARDLADDGEDADCVTRFEAREGVTLDKTGLYVRDEPKKTGPAPKPAASEGE